MSGDSSKAGGLNPNAMVFVPRAAAVEFVPGQPMHAPPPEAPQPTDSEGPKAEPEKQLSNGVQPEAAAAPEPTPQPASQPAPPVEEENKEEWEAGDEGEEEEEEEEEEKATKPKKQAAAEPEAGPKREPVNVIFIGHVDAGKSTIGGHIMKLTGMVDERTLAKYEREAKEKNRESWYLSWALDTNQEERDKGKTVEVGRAYFETEKKHFTILDAPGHKSFVPNMIGGASQADLAVLVISARRGEFETGFDRGGQTREHAMLAKTAGVKHLVILVNKMDEADWAEERFQEIVNGLTPYLRKIGFNPKTDLFFIPCSGLNGAFLKTPPAPGVCSWYSGPCFIDYIDALPSINRRIDGPVRVKLTDKYSDMGTIVMGKIESGTVTKGQELTIMPNKTKVSVLQLWSDEVETTETVAGENVKLKLKGVEEAEIMPGFVLCSPNDLCKVGRILDAQVVITEAPAASIICPGYTAVLHIHAAVEEAQVKNLICLVDKKTHEKIKPPGGLRFVKVDQACIMRLECPEVFCMDTFKDFPEMARLTLRDEGRTIAIGKVLKVVE